MEQIIYIFKPNTRRQTERRYCPGEYNEYARPQQVHSQQFYARPQQVRPQQSYLSIIEEEKNIILDKIDALRRPTNTTWEILGSQLTTQAFEYSDRNKKWIVNAPIEIKNQHPEFFRQQSTEMHRKKHERTYPIGGSFNAFSGSKYGGEASY